MHQYVLISKMKLRDIIWFIPNSMGVEGSIFDHPLLGGGGMEEVLFPTPIAIFFPVCLLYRKMLKFANEVCLKPKPPVPRYTIGSQLGLYTIGSQLGLFHLILIILLIGTHYA